MKSIPLGHLLEMFSNRKFQSMTKDETDHWRLRLIELMRALDLSQKDIANTTEIAATYISRLLYPPGKKSRKEIGLATMRTISRCYNLAPGWFDMPLQTDLPEKTKPGHRVEQTRAHYNVTVAPLNQAIKLLKQMPEDKLPEVISFLTWQLASTPPKTHGQTLSMAA